MARLIFGRNCGMEDRHGIIERTKTLLNRMLRVHKEDISIRAIIDTFDDRRKDKKDSSNMMSDEDFWKTILVFIEQTQLSKVIPN